MKYKATRISCIFSLVSFVSTWTVAIPFLVTIPTGWMLESLMKKMYGPVPYSQIGKSAIVALLLLFALSTAIYVRSVRNQLKQDSAFSSITFSGYLVLQLFIIHPLFFYIDASQDWSRAGDGQFVFSILDTFPYSSLSFVFIGVAMDLYKNSILKKIKKSDSV